MFHRTKLALYDYAKRFKKRVPAQLTVQHHICTCSKNIPFEPPMQSVKCVVSSYLHEDVGVVMMNSEVILEEVITDDIGDCTDDKSACIDDTDVFTDDTDACTDDTGAGTDDTGAGTDEADACSDVVVERVGTAQNNQLWVHMQASESFTYKAQQDDIPQLH